MSIDEGAFEMARREYVTQLPKVRRTLALKKAIEAYEAAKITDQPVQYPYEQFFRAMWEEYCEGNLDISELVYGNAVKFGLAKEELYDPETHPENLASEWGLEKGDPCYVLVKQPKRESGWQPIETAPKDGTAILVCNPDFSSDNMAVACWDNGWQFSDSPQQHYIGASHWMPLPKRPTTRIEDRN